MSNGAIVGIWGMCVDVQGGVPYDQAPFNSLNLQWRSDSAMGRALSTWQAKSAIALPANANFAT